MFYVYKVRSNNTLYEHHPNNSKFTDEGTNMITNIQIKLIRYFLLCNL